MAVGDRERQVIQDVFDAMQAGPSGELKMMAVFAENAVMTEPFEGMPQTHTGKQAIRDRFMQMWTSGGPPDLHLTVNQVDIQGHEARADWTCTSSVFRTPMQGHDLFEFADGMVTRLDMVVTTWPETEGGHH